MAPACCVASTAAGAARLGRGCLTRALVGATPITLVACIHSTERNERDCSRMTRAYATQPVTISVINTLATELPNVAVMAMAKTTNGIANCTSEHQLTTRSM